jgi:hypothetical protein
MQPSWSRTTNTPASTNLSRKYVEITVTPEASSCPSQYGALQSSETITLRDMAFLHEIGSGVATGNFYDWESYSTTKNSVCVNLTFMLHSVDVGNYATPPEQFAQFDKPEEAKVFPRIFSTFTW